jgi:hypothetical protein
MEYVLEKLDLYNNAEDFSDESGTLLLNAIILKEIQSVSSW